MMTDGDETPDQSGLHEDAESVLLQIAKYDEIREEHSLIADYCDDDDLRSIVNLAWRYQFVDDRHSFKKAIRELQQHVAMKAKASNEVEL